MINTDFRGLALAVLGCVVAGLLSACADQQAVPEPQAAPDQQVAATLSQEANDQKEQPTMQRVIVNLTPSEMPVSDQVVELTRKYPQSKTLRVFAGFRQVVLELPADDMKALAAEPEVQQVALDQRNSPSN